ncbi:hypothetical protein CSA17_06990 [bacterium DOLJORAL78_65_58]|nr:MAG: hypothetical protein CSA17_06990 [bacterium DOLJORAL78_65_58]
MDTAPFQILAEGRKPPRPRGLNTPEGLGDRMRTAAFAEKQAIHAFRWACERFQDVPGELRAAWAALIPEEEKHYRLIVTRMAELGFALDARPVTLNLWWPTVSTAGSPNEDPAHFHRWPGLGAARSADQRPAQLRRRVLPPAGLRRRAGPVAGGRIGAAGGCCPGGAGGAPERHGPDDA